jgi:hypothetical protein
MEMEFNPEEEAKLYVGRTTLSLRVLIMTLKKLGRKPKNVAELQEEGHIIYCKIIDDVLYEAEEGNLIG